MTDNTTFLEFSFPPIYAIKTDYSGNLITQIIKPGYLEKVVFETVQTGNTWGYLLRTLDAKDTILAITDNDFVTDEFQKVVKISTAMPFPNYADAWLRHPELDQTLSIENEIDFPKRIRNVLDSWTDNFTFKSESETSNGLRPPQIGALHAILAHWTISKDPATVVLPTGTGKTETMLAVLVAQQCQKILVVVPTDALRFQISDKFETLGVLKQVGVLSENALYPIVGLLKHKPKSIAEVELFFEKCNVVVTTMSIAGTCSADLQERMSTLCPFLFIDEAHHIGAQTWGALKKKFEDNYILQFTATPFRNDGKNVGGKIIYNYPLAKAQEQGYFKKIRFDPVKVYALKKSDQSIAEKAVDQLRKDQVHFNHILMARVDSIHRAKEVFGIYKKYQEFKPVQLHTGLSEGEREKARKAILNGESKIVVCVDMLGEGFDLPTLKIAAFHDVKKSLPITLQLAGRFVRSRSDLGDPTFIANIADLEVQEELRKLYSQDADWNVLLQQTSETVIQNQMDLYEFLSGFTNLPEEIAIQNIRPALSTVIYRTKCANWMPKKFKDGLDNPKTIEQLYHDVNRENNMLVIISGRKNPIDWAHVKEINNLVWELLILIWDQEKNLLYINGSGNNGYYKKLAHSVAGEADLIKDSDVFRSLSGINRLRLQNVGLLDQNGKLIKYTMRAGSDIESGLAEAQKRFARRANIFGVGYGDGRRTSIGCSYKGRIWSRRDGNLDELMDWCKLVGAKVTDISIDPNTVLAGTLVSISIKKRPKKMPIWIDWPEIFYNFPEAFCTFVFDGKHKFSLLETDIKLLDPSENDNIRFEIVSDDIRIQIVLSISSQGYQFSVIDGHHLSIRFRAVERSIEDYLYDNPPPIYFFDGSSLEGNSYIELNNPDELYAAEKIMGWDWKGTNIRKESQGIQKETDSIQYKVLRKLMDENYALLFDDDGSGEIADIVAIKENVASLDIDIFHCKYSNHDLPGARVEDLYAVCGQAQKSTSWKERLNTKPGELFVHMLRREDNRIENQQASRIEKGSRDLIELLKVKSQSCPVKMRIFIVQPGMSRSRASDKQLRLLGVTESYLMQTYNLSFGVISGL